MQLIQKTPFNINYYTYGTLKLDLFTKLIVSDELIEKGSSFSWRLCSLHVACII